MNRELSFPDFNAARARSSSSSRVPDNFFSATSSRHYRNADPIFSHLPPLHPISTTHEVPRFPAYEIAVPSPTTVCNLPQPNDAAQSALAQVAALLSTLGFGIHRQEAPLSDVLPRHDGASENAVPLPVPIPIQTSLLMPVGQADNAVANAPGQRPAQQLPAAAPAAVNPQPSSVRPKWDPEVRDLLLKSANRPRFLESSGIRIRAFLEDAENFFRMCGRPRDRWAFFIISWLGANESEKVRRAHFFSEDVKYNALKNGVITLFARLEFEDSYCQKLRELAQTDSESVVSYAARATDLTTRVYPIF